MATIDESIITDAENLMSTIRAHGVAIIPGVLNEQEILQMRNDMWDTLEILTQKFPTPIDRNNKETWKMIYELFPLHSMLIQHHGIGHSSLAWNVRKNPKVVAIYEQFYGVEYTDLLTSFDGVSIAMPPEITNRGWCRGTNWLHIDQSYARKGFETLQSWVTAFDVNDGDATLTYLSKSHLVHDQIIDENKEDFNVLDNPEKLEIYKNAGCEQKFITCKAGDMVFWDSRTVHSGIEPRKLRLKRGDEEPVMRCVVYVCMVPRKEASNANIVKKTKAFLEHRTTTHNPARVKLFPKAPRTYGKALMSISALPEPQLSQREKRLAGFN